MISSLSPSMNFFLNGINQLQTTINTSTERMSSGYRINQPSDAPDQISPLLQLQANLSHNQTIATNLSTVQTDVTSADQAMSSAIQLMDQARSLGAQGATATATAANRTELANGIESVQEQMVALADTNVNGHYIFSGDQSATQPYALDLNQPVNVPQNGVDRLLTIPVTATRQVELSDRTFTTVDQTAQDVFDHRNPDDSLATDNVFAALNNMRVALTNNDTPNILIAQTSLQTASTYLNAKETFYGNAANRLTAATNQITTENNDLTQQISNIRDTDVAQTALALTSAETQSQAAMAAEGKIPRTTMFDFLA